MSQQDFSHNAPLFKSLFSDSAVVVAIKIFGLASGFGIYFLLAKVLGPADFGIYSYVVSFGIIGAIVARLGLDAILIRIVVEAQENNTPALARGMIRWALATAVLLCMLLGLGLFFYMRTSDTPALIYAIPIMTGVALTVLGTSVLRAINKGPWVAWPEFLGRPGLTFAFLCAAVLAGLSLTTEYALAIHALVAITLSLVVLLQVFRSLPPEIAQAVPQYRAAKWLLIAVPVLWNNIILLSEPQLVIIIAGTFLPPEEVGPISLVSRLAALAGIAEVGVNFIMPPILSRLYQRADTAGMQRSMRLAGRIMVLPTVPALLVFWFFGREILSYFGEAYLIAFWPLLIFTLTRAVSGIFGPAAVMLLMSGNERDVALASTISVAVMVVLSLLLMVPMGPMGMALAVLASALTRVLMNWLSVRRRLGINSFIMLWS